MTSPLQRGLKGMVAEPRIAFHITRVNTPECTTATITSMKRLGVRRKPKGNMVLPETNHVHVD
jgi:hypothetical protein